MFADLPQPVADELCGEPVVGELERAFILLTVREDDVPHVTLLSRAEIEGRERALHVSLAGSRTAANARRTGVAALFVTIGTTAYSVDLVLRSSLEHRGMVGLRLGVAACREDSLGIPLQPLGFVAPPELPSLERWEVSAEILELLLEHEAQENC